MMRENQREIYYMTANKMAGPITLKWILSCPWTWLKWPVRACRQQRKTYFFSCRCISTLTPVTPRRVEREEVRALRPPA